MPRMGREDSKLSFPLIFSYGDHAKGSVGFQSHGTLSFSALCRVTINEAETNQCSSDVCLKEV